MNADISIVIPAYKRKDGLRRCLESVFRQDTPAERIEIIVVDDSSREDIRLMVEALGRDRPGLRYLVQPHRGPAAARNRGAQAAAGEVIGFVDDDCVMDPHWVRAMLDAHRENPDAAAVGGFTEIATRKTTVLVSQSLANGSIETWLQGKRQVIFFPTCNVSFKKSVFERYRFDESFPLPGGEDLEFFWRLFKDGLRLVWDRRIKVVHYRNDSFLHFIKQAYIYGRGNYLVQHLHGDHPLLKELKTGRFSFWGATAVNAIKIPRFAFLLGRRIIDAEGIRLARAKVPVYAYLALHKVFYLAGNVAEFIRLSVAGYRRCPQPQRRAPHFLIVDVTHRCNLKCNICDIRKDAQAQEFSTQEIQDLISQAHAWGVEEFVLSGGEPFVRGDIFGILDFAKKLRYHVGVLSNGIMLSDDFIGKLLPYFDAGVLSLSVSLDALTPAIHDDIRGQAGSFEKTARGLAKLSELKKSHPRLNFNTISIVLNENLEELPALAGFLKSLDVNSVQFQPLLANNLVMRERSTRVKYWVPPERYAVLDKTIDALVEFRKRNAGLVRNSERNLLLMKKYFRGELAKEDVKCHYVTKTMLIANTGDATTCFDCYGNVRRAPLKEIYNSSAAAKAIERTQNCKAPCLLPCFCDY